MSKKAIDPTDTYRVRQLFGCGAGHFLTEGYTHWEEGEACPWGGHDDGEDYHLYYREFWVPTEQTGGQDSDEYFADNPGKWGHLPLVEKSTGFKLWD